MKAGGWPNEPDLSLDAPCLPVYQFWLLTPSSHWAEHCLLCDKAIFLGTDPGSHVKINTTSLSLSSFRRHSTKRERLLSADYETETDKWKLFNYCMKNIFTIKKIFKDFFVNDEKSTRTAAWQLCCERCCGRDTAQHPLSQLPTVPPWSCSAVPWREDTS